MQPERRPPRTARPARLDALEERALLSASFGLIGLPVDALLERPSPPPGLMIDPVTSTLPKPAVMPEDTATLGGFRKVVLDLPWRIASHQAFHPKGAGLPTPGSTSGLGRASFAPETAIDLTVADRFAIEGVVTPAEQGHLFRLAVGPQHRSIRLSFEAIFPEGGDPIPQRVWISNAGGKILDSWHFDGSSRRLDVQLRALFPPSPTVFFLGIEAAEVSGSMAGMLAYSLEVQRETSPVVFQFPTSNLTEEDSFTPVSSIPNWPEYAEGPLSRSRLPGSYQGVGRGPVGGLSSLDASSSGRLTLGEVGVSVSSPFGVGRGLVRPLPIQSASAVGGLLPAGPAVRGDGPTAGRPPHRGGFDEALGVVAEAILADGRGPDGRAGVGPGFVPGWEGPLTLADSEGPGRAPSSPSDSSSIAVSRPGGPAGLPTLGEGLRVVWGRPPILPSRDLSPAVDEFSSIGLPAVEPAPGDPDSPGETAEVADPDSEIDPTRPRVLRTALIGVAALAVGLLLPDLTAERPLLLQRRTWPQGPRRSLRPRAS